MQTQGRVYKEAIDSGAYSVMIGHAAFPAVDDSRIGKKRRPSTFSKKVITDLLKEKFGLLEERVGELEKTCRGHDIFKFETERKE